MLAGLLVPWWDFVINSSTSALRGEERKRVARDDAEDLAGRKKAEAKRRAKKLYKAILAVGAAEVGAKAALAERAALVPLIAPFAPNVAQDLLPPLEAVKFDLLVLDVVALAALYEAFYALLADDEEAILTIILAV